MTESWWSRFRRKPVAPVALESASDGEPDVDPEHVEVAKPTVATSALSADQPIETPDQDAFGFDPFARAIATSIAGLKSPEGLVIGLHGPWGAGKSSAVNLIRGHLAGGDMPCTQDLTIVEFNPWWFNGQDALAQAFFSELGTVIGKSLPEKARDALRVLGRRLSGAGSMIGAAVDLATAGAAGGAAEGAASLVGDLLGSERTVPEEHAVLSKALKTAGRRFLVIVDDLDRLAPDEALLMFKLVKSVGRLPNVMYLLVFDRELAERAVADKFPSEGAHFLEKIIQASFELPPPEPHDLRDLLLANVQRLMGDVEGDEAVRFMNLFYDIVAPHILRPRDVVRLTNALEVTWPAVAGEVNRADFLAIETLRLNWPQVHRAIYNNKSLISGIRVDFQDQRVAAADCERLLLGGVPEDRRSDLKQSLQRLFPALEGVWGNLSYTAEFGGIWRQERRVCVEAYFDTYFRFALSDQVTPAAELDALIAGASNCDQVQSALRSALATPRRRGGTRAAVLLDELTYNAGRVAVADIAPLVVAIFGMADELAVPADKAGAFATGDNHLRVHWLLNRLVTDRLDEAGRDAVIEPATRQATINWRIDVTLRGVAQHAPRKNGQGRSSPPIVSAQASERMRAETLAAVESLAEQGKFFELNDPVSKLFRWRDLIGDQGLPRVKAWLEEQLSSDTVVVRLAESFVSVGWRHSSGDLVAQSFEHLSRTSVEALVDPEILLARVAAILAKNDAGAVEDAILNRFQTAWARALKGDDWGDDE